MKIPVKLLEKSEKKYSLTKTQLEKKKHQIDTETAYKLDSPEVQGKRKKMLERTAPEDAELAYERYIGNNDLLPINFLAIGYQKSRAVGRLRYFDLTVNENALATGFLITPDLVMTNHHVFSGKGDFKEAYIEFDYAFDANGKEMAKIVFAIDPGKFFYTDETLDLTIVGVKAMDETNIHSITDRGFLVLNPDTGKAGVGDFATIIQFPDGNWQQIALRENKILEFKTDALIYTSDTSTGSSGSPVFNDQWQVIALHSAGVAKKNDAGEYVDKDNKPLAETSGKVDSSQIDWVSNTGMRISAICAHLFADTTIAGNLYLMALKNPAYSDDKTSNAPLAAGAPSGSPVVSPTEALVPAAGGTLATGAGLTPASPLTIQITVGGGPAPAAISISGLTTTAGTGLTAGSAPPDGFESKLEDGADYSACTGFDELFMGTRTPFPGFTSIKKKIAAYTNTPSMQVLKYDHYSSIQHILRKMPVVSAINVQGSPADRQDKAKRKDSWLRDNRISYDYQLTNDYYAKSGFDKGHMSRREDADWGDSPADALASANMTCMFTNAVPQVPKINRASEKGQWGELEDIVLEKGVELEKGQSSKICVYNGPVFADSDPIYKSVQVPLQFFKIIAWLNAAGQMKATGFVLSQSDLVQNIKFEDLHFDQEFIPYQASITYIEQQTGLSFDGIKQFDTYEKTGTNEVKVLRTDDLAKLIKKNK